MQVRVLNAQKEAAVPVKAMEKLARRAVKCLKIRRKGLFHVTFISSWRMRRLNGLFLRHHWATDVLTFRYDGESVAGELLVAPAQARRYAKTHGIAYRHELARYVVHGLLHWTGLEDATPKQQQRMRRLEDALLKRCGVIA